MSKLIYCEFNTDTACAELLFADGCLISIDRIAVENEVADDCFDRASWTGSSTTSLWNMMILY